MRGDVGGVAKQRCTIHVYILTYVCISLKPCLEQVSVPEPFSIGYVDPLS